MRVVYGLDTGSIEDADQCVVIRVPDSVEDVEGYIKSYLGSGPHRLVGGGLAEWDAQVVVDGFQRGDVDHVDLLALLKDPFAWVAESDSTTAEAIRKGYLK